MSGWFGRWRRVDALERETAELRGALSEAMARIDVLSAASSAVRDEAARAVDQMAARLVDQDATLTERVAASSERIAAAVDRLDALERRVQEIADDLGRRLDEAERRSIERATEQRASVEMFERPVSLLQAEVRRLDARLRTHVEETEKMGAALLDRTGFPRLGDLPTKPHA